MKNSSRMIVDIGMMVLLLCLMAYQVTGEVLHEWIGVGMTALVLCHQVFNRKWYGSVFKGKYRALRVFMTAVNLLLIVSFLLTAFCGMSMSGHAVPFLYGMVPVSFAREMHLSMSHWSFVLMGLHLGFHIPIMTARFQWSDRTRNILAGAFAVIAGALVFLENILMLLFWALIGREISVLCKGAKNPLTPVGRMMAAVIIGLVLSMAMTGNRSDSSFDTGERDTTQESEETENHEMPAPDADMGEGLSVHYSGGASLPDDVRAWLGANGVGGE